MPRQWTKRGQNRNKQELHDSKCYHQKITRWIFSIFIRLEIALLCKILQIALFCKRPKRSVAFSQLWSPPPLCRCLRPAPLLRQKPTAPKCSDLPFNSETQFPIDNLNVSSVPCKHVGGIPHEHQFFMCRGFLPAEISGLFFIPLNITQHIVFSKCGGIHYTIKMTLFQL